MTIKSFTIIWSLAHTLVMFLLLFKSRYPNKKTITLTFSAMAPLIIINMVLLMFMGADSYMKIMLLTLSLPSLVFFWILSRYRDGRFVFTFCMVDTIVMEIIYATNIIDQFIPGDWVILFGRLIIYPLIEWYIYKKIRTPYNEIQSQVKKGWWIFAFIGALFYLAMTLLMNMPTISEPHPEHIPLLCIMFILVPVSYMNIFNTLRHQQKVHNSSEQENILKVQVSDIKNRIEEFSVANSKFRTERHDFRHKLQTISRLIENKEYDQLENVVAKYGETLEETKIKRYCENVVLDAVFSSYIQRAEALKINITTNIKIPQVLPVNDIELATVFANAIENAIHACEKLNEENRYISIKVISVPKFMVQIENTYDGNSEFNENGLPVTHEEGHGFGTRSIAAFCDKNNAFYDFKADKEKFTLRIAF